VIRLVIRPGLPLLFGLLTSACGSRTGLDVNAVCGVAGETRPCFDGCASGLQTCDSGVWLECVAPVVKEACSDVCGTGERTCVQGTFGACVVPPSQRPCENVCGIGIETCENAAWSACEVPDTILPCSSKCGDGTQPCSSGVLGACNAPQPLPPVLEATVRDFLASHPDMEREEGRTERGLVLPELGDDDKPVYAHGTQGTFTTSGEAAFDQWYRDVPGVNQTTTVPLPLLRSARDERLYLFNSAAFFPIDGDLFGNEGNVHNYHFTLEASGTFLYQGGERFRFLGDDDVFVFINRTLVIDLGGLHQSLSQEVYLDGIAPKIGLELGGLYPLHIFFAERKTLASNFNIETSIEGLGDCP